MASSISDENLYATPRGDHPDVVLNGDVSGRASDVEDFVKASTAIAAERSAATLWKGVAYSCFGGRCVWLSIFSVIVICSAVSRNLSLPDPGTRAVFD